MKKILFLILAVFAWKHFYYIESAPELGPGILAGGDPYQNTPSETSFRVGDYTYYPRAKFEIEARVISAAKYYFDQEARISPMDLALGWGAMSDEEVLNEIDVWQENRMYRWKSDNLPIPEYDVINFSANMHIIPSSDSIANKLKQIKIGDLVHIQGYLVDVKKASGWKWHTSTTRTDEGSDASEIVYAKSLTIVNPFERLYY